MAQVRPLEVPVVASRAVPLITVSTVLQTLASITVLLRFLSKRANRSIGLDDWVALVALVFSFGLYITGILICTVGFAGFHMDILLPNQIEKFLLFVYVDNIFYALTLPTIKFSILLMYSRIFRVKPFQYVAAAVGLIVAGWMIGVVFAQIFTCTPVEGAWKITVARHCIDQIKFYYGNAIANLLTDVIILCLPLPLIWRLNMSTRKKRALSGVFLLGGFVCISSLLRIVSLRDIDNNDITYTLVTTGVWTSTETPLAIVCACLPTLPAYFKSWHQKMSLNRSKGTEDASSRRSLRTQQPQQWTEDHEELGGNITPLSNLSLGKKERTEAGDMDTNQIRVTSQFTVENRNHS
ncbi:hypothetical protein EPUS_00420 [Endocarpon pusillum Z07020]|uniref:Rhodopsin domain-containing protein n=1 Tax=Endocarpon pusillum (strain Z07020 / HMAS-L-300199) TaxID=1263415 RepID=U1FZ81_ENDPU|nr:uncharacterized protein EPUS_00420 [Endocarpon pusillum Z07020]ERF70232.1 hypothetical protein EPUS_00420 [Endocarpon pusillum Z07020]